MTKQKVISNSPVEIIETDELFSFIKRKSSNLHVYMNVKLLDDIAFDRSNDGIQKLVDNLPKASQYYSDAYFICLQIYYFEKHTFESGLYC